MTHQILYIEYELQCECGYVKHANGFVRLFEAYLNHDPDRQHQIKVLHFLNNRVRVMSNNDIDRSINYVKSEAKKLDDAKFPFGHFRHLNNLI